MPRGDDRGASMSQVGSGRAASYGALLAALSLTSCATASGDGAAIAEAQFVTLGGLEQWVTIRGSSPDNPVLLVLHGGPGDVQSTFVEDYAPYERDFVIVHWDQRGAGKTFGKNGDATPDLTLERLARDGLELAEWLRRRFDGNDLVVMGHSFGTAIATEMVRRRPQLFSAYVGTGQIASWEESVHWQFEFLRQKAAETNDTEMLASLAAIGTPDPMNAQQYFAFSGPIRRFVNSSDARWLAGLREHAQSAERHNDADFEAIVSGMTFSGRALLAAQMNERLSSEALAFELPYVVIQGQHDLFTPTAPAVAYFEAIAAPQKRLVLLPEAGHFALVTHAAEFASALEAALADLLH
jgi:pimeloyl-ACP methyl ester carboxylesterase